MDETPKTDTKSTQQKWHLAKILLHKFGVLGEFHVKQLEAYTFACCNISIDSEFEIVTDEFKVMYRIKTSKNYVKNKAGEVTKRHKWSPYKLKHIGKYDKEVRLAAKNLKSWTKRLLWEDDTKVEITIDEVKA